MSDPRRFDALRASYRILWDAHQAVAHRNAALLRAGKELSTEQLADEQRAAASVAAARDELLAAISRLGN
jgi:hypothetical protein